MTHEFNNRRKPDKLQWLLVWLLGLIAAGIGYQILLNQQAAIMRTQVDVLIRHDEERIEKWQIDQLSRQLLDIQVQLRKQKTE